MGVNRKAKIYTFMGIYYILYVIATMLHSTLWGDLFSPIGSILALLIFIHVFKRAKAFRFAWISLSLACFSWSLTDVGWAVMELVFHGSPNEYVIFDFFYLLPNLFLLVGGFYYIIKISERLNLIQLLLDATAISLSLMGLMWILLLQGDFTRFLKNIGDQILFISSITDFLMLTGMLIWFFSFRKGTATKALYILLTGVNIYAGIDILYCFISFYDLYIPNTIIDAGYVLSFLVMTVGGIESILLNTEEWSNKFYERNNNIGGNKRSLFLLVPPVILLLFQKADVSGLIYFIGIFTVYQVLSNYVQGAVRNEEMLIKEKEMNSRLELTISERTKELIEINLELEHIARHDFVTDLYNIRYFKELLENKIEADKTPFAILYIDLDRFKSINDTYGHDTGDRILVEISTRLKDFCREGEIVARIGGDEFVLILEPEAERTKLKDRIDRLIHKCSEPIHVQNYPFQLTMSVGISMYPEDGETRGRLLRNADIAMYSAKMAGLNQYAFYTKSMNDAIEEKYEIENLLLGADFDNEFFLVYQPQIDIQENRLIGFEALIRWNSPKKGMIFPDRFICVAEETGLIINIGDWVMRKAANQILQWNRRYQSDLKMSINISPYQLEDTSFIERVNSLLSLPGFKSSWLDIEITENIAMKGEAMMEEVFGSLASMDISTSIDDFGTGYSILSYIHQFSFDRIKIAKPLIDSITVDFSKRQIVEAIILMSKALKVRTIAEGVEMLDQVNLLKELDCDEIQGYYFSRPKIAEDIEKEFLEDGKVTLLRN